MKCGDRVYSLKNKKIGIYSNTIRESGYLMAYVEYNNSKDLEYPEQLISLEKQYSNSELWNMADNKILPLGTIIEDNQGNQLIYTGKSFQEYYSNIIEEKYIGFCVGDKWEIIDVDEKSIFNKRKKVMKLMKIKYLAKTDKGYIKTSNGGVEFVNKENARRFTENEARGYRDSIVADVFEFYGCEEFYFEKIFV